MRFKPTRAGIFNVWEYDDQTFEFGDGRLALRGRNGSGKSNALSLLFPFVLDGVMSAARMDPMGGGRSMKSLLLGRDDDDRASRFRHDSGTGYVWMEFGNGPDFLTIGIGAAATQQRDADPWFFVTRRRVGRDLDLAENDIPLGRRQLQDRLTDGAVYTTAEEYRSAVDRHLLGLGTLRYRRLVDLLLTLRRPHLAGKLDIEHLSSTLSAGLGELDSSLIDDVAHSFDDLDAMQHQLEDLAMALAAVERFLPVYRDHLVSVGRTRGETVVEADQAVRNLGRRLSEAVRGHDEATTQVEDLQLRSKASVGQRVLLDGQIENIQQSPAYQNAVALDEVRKSADKAARIAADADGRAVDAATTTEDAARTVESARGELQAATDQVGERVAEWNASARASGLDVAVPPTDFDDAAATIVVAERRRQHDELRELVRVAAETATEAGRAEQSAVTARDAAVTATTDLEAAERTTAEVLQALQAERDTWVAALGATLGDLRELAPDLIDDRAIGEPDRWFLAPDHEPEPDDGTTAPTTAVAQLATDAIAGATTAERIASGISTVAARAVDAAETAMAAQQRTVDNLGAERQRVADEPNPGPPPNPTRPDATIDGRTGAPLYVCVDFAPSVGEAERAGIEAALGAAGLLDARLAADGVIDDALDAAIRSTETVVNGTTLADVLVPVDVPGLDNRRIGQVLRSVPLDTDIVQLRTDGSWQLGPLGGRFTQPSPRFIGHTAREARRAERLAVLDAELAAADSELKDLTERVRSLDAVSGELAALQAQQPSIRALSGALAQLRQAEVISGERSARHDEAVTLAAGLLEIAASASSLLHSTAARLHLPATSEALQGIRSALDRCEVLRQQIASDRTLAGRAERAVSTTETNLANATARSNRAADDAATAAREAELERQRYDQLSADVGGDALAAIAALAEARAKRDRIVQEVEGLATQLAAATGDLSRLSERIDLLNGHQEAAGAVLLEAEQRFGVICTSEIAEVLGIDGVGPEHDPKSGARALLTNTEPRPPDATNQMEKAHREVLLDGLRAGYDPSMPKIDGVDVVRVGSADGDLPIGTLARQLRDEHERTAQLLTQNEREIFETHLLTRVGDSLRALLLDADSFEHRINDEMSKVPTESGMVVELRWEVSGAEPGLSDAVKSLRTAPEMLGPERREALRDFFMRRIADLRSTEPGRSFAETLTSALDYRSWHTFSLYARFTTGSRQRVTRTFYRGLSGGEAATLLHLPLFAAAAAQYEHGAVDGPRMIALDEAFVGIDDKMRARLMGLLTQLDLDVILTSHEFWGFYDTVPALVLYDLIRRPPTPGVYAQRFDWISDTGSSSHDATA